MKIVEDVCAVRDWSESTRSAGLSIGLVPTMGALHDGHLSLLDRARRDCERVAVSIFVNPTQFDSGSDLDNYPRTRERDLELCEEHGVDFVFLGQSRGPGGIYDKDFKTWIHVEKISASLCGKLRPGHFRGVATVVTLLFNLFRPDRAYFGQKDFQQARLIQKMATDLHTGVDVRVLPTVREPDGLALSSRNRHLSESERDTALAISRGLGEAEKAFGEGEERISELEEAARRVIGSAAGIELQYLNAVDANTVEPCEASSVSAYPDGVVIAVAAFVGETRLIDNVWLRKDS